MKKVILFFLILIILIILLPSKILAYDPLTKSNNIYGIGIVNHSDLDDVSSLVNVNGGDWGYVTIVITESERNKEVWQRFFDSCRRLHLIPIMRVASKFENNNWNVAKIEEIDSWVNFFNSLNWVIENRYVIIGNEPNHSKEWGGKINPAEYAIYLKTFADRLHNANQNYFVLNAGFDQAASNSKNTMDEQKYIKEMQKEIPDIFNFIDGWNSHSYPNPAFSGSKTSAGRKSIRGYEWELNLVNKDLPIFITETGWIRNKKNEKQIAENLKYAYEKVWTKNKNIVAVTPFILNYTEEPFYDFSWKKSNTEFFPIYSEIQKINKIKGEPIQKISGEIVFNFLNPLVVRNSDMKGFSLIKNTGQAIWTESESIIKSENNSGVRIVSTQFNNIEPMANGLIFYTLKSPDKQGLIDIKVGFYIKGEKIGDIINGKIVSF